MLKVLEKVCLNFAFSIRMKGPKSQRILTVAEKERLQARKTEDFFAEYYESTRELYKNSFTAEELRNSPEEVKRVFRLENATPSEILKFRIDQAVKKYQKHFSDHGSPGVQCAAMSERVILLMMHTKKYPHDTKAARYLTKLLDQRRKMLTYLSARDYHRYVWICSDYGIPQVHAGKTHNKKLNLMQNSWQGRYT